MTIFEHFLKQDLGHHITRYVDVYKGKCCLFDYMYVQLACSHFEECVTQSFYKHF